MSIPVAGLCLAIIAIVLAAIALGFSIDASVLYGGARQGRLRHHVLGLLPQLEHDFWSV